MESLHNDEYDKYALLSYLNDGLHLDEGDAFFGGHTNKWECREIAHLLHQLGYNVDVIHYLNDTFIPARPYDVAIDIHANLHRLSPLLPKACRKVLHATGSYVPSLIEQEAERLAELRRRKGVNCRPRRSSNGQTYSNSLRVSDYVSLIGNDVTLSTYPPEIQSKTTCLNATASVTQRLDRATLPNRREFLWLGGGGAVLKGLDLLLEVFANRPEIHLNIVGGGGGERDFAKAYRRELFELNNIEYHDFLDVSGPEFHSVAERSVAVIKPSASEGMSTAVTTAMTVGFYPIISRQTGIDLPDGTGIYLDDLSHAAIETAIGRVLSMSESDLIDDIKRVQDHAGSAYSRENFSKRYRQFLTDEVGV
ncbi:glycosyltransferase [Hoeflea sp. TYP-13]|uniref:glycosyltransferase n=1 Tax=Hoeflea sp. TYP-13 TaxID=3230023 RepID=UPI0034C6251A